MHKREPRTGDIVAALVDGNAATLKTLVKDKDRFILRAANERYKDIVAANLEVQGVLVGLVRTGGPQAHVPKVDQARTALGFL
jgi:repressor LexA